MSPEYEKKLDVQHDHSKLKPYRVSRSVFGGPIEATGLCGVCGEFTREANPEEISRFKRIQSIPLTEYKHNILIY
jgi:hypothetical protein